MAKKKKATGSAPNISKLGEAIEDAQAGALDFDSGPSEPADFFSLMGRLNAARDNVPPIYRQAIVDPFIATLQSLGQSGFNRILDSDPQRRTLAGLMLDIAQSILQQGESFEVRATDALQEVVSDLFDGFLSAGRRRGVKPPDHSVIAPLVKWGSPRTGPYTWPIDAASRFGLDTGVVSMPPANLKRGILAWAAAGHEVGHDILHADDGLLSELSSTVQKALDDENVGDFLPSYWANRIDETASDVLGVLNLGPSAAIGLIGYFRGLRAASGGAPKLGNEGGTGPHPADILRGFLGAAAVRHLSFDAAAAWADLILEETIEDVTSIRLVGQSITRAQAKKSAEVVAEVLVSTPMTTLDGHALCEIKNWTNSDESKVSALRETLTTSEPIPTMQGGGFCAAHALAAGVTSTLAGIKPLPSIFDRMLSVLQAMHHDNPINGPLMVPHRSSVFRRVLINESDG